VASPVSEDEYRVVAGTSFSCPLAAGVAALVLCRQPTLMPMEVRSAMRRTADRADAPDNDYGWGVLDAFAAVTYWGPFIVHDALTDRELIAESYEIVASISDRLPLDEAQIWLHYRLDGEGWEQASLESSSSDLYSAAIPGSGAAAVIEYYLEARDTEGFTAHWPSGAPDITHSFSVGPDSQPPVLAHEPLEDQPRATWPPVVRATASDNIGIDRVELTFTVDGGVEHGPHELLASAESCYRLVFPLPHVELAAGQVVTYTLTAHDATSRQNTATSGPHGFEITASLGRVLVIDDDYRPTSPRAAGTSSTHKDEDDSSARIIARWLTLAGFDVELVEAESFTPSDLTGRQLMIWSLGSNVLPIDDPRVALAAENWALAEGRVLIEGAGVATLTRLSTVPGVSQSVLHADDWQYCYGDLLPAPGQELHPLLVYPNELPVPLVDVPETPPHHRWNTLIPNDQSQAILSPVLCSGGTSLLVFDDGNHLGSALTVAIGLDIKTLPEQIGSELIENAVGFLMRPQREPAATVTGHVTLVGRTDHSGITVSCSNGEAVTTGHHGLYSFGPLHPGVYEVSASKPGFAMSSKRFTLDREQQITGADLVLESFVSYENIDAAAIPDAGQGVLSSAVQIEESADVLSLTVDIELTHPRPEDLTIMLAHHSVLVALHSRSTGNDGGIIGAWPETLEEDVPGWLGGFPGLPVAGEWLLTVQDQVTGQTGTLHRWSLDIQLIEPSLPDLPRTTLLAMIAPNPFNAGTEIVFDLARPSRTRLTIFDLRGRLVRDLLDRNLPAGRYSEQWNSLDDGGRSVGSGIYLVVLHADGVQQVKKVTIVR